jgi:O-antigen/teichoic acid export membrane protein
MASSPEDRAAVERYAQAAPGDAGFAPAPAHPTLGRRMSWLTAGYAARSLASVLLATMLARSLGPAAYGELSLFIAFAAGIAVLAGAWPFLAVPILTARGPTIGAVFRPALTLSLSGAAVGSLVFLPLAWIFVAPDALVVALLVVYALALLGLNGAYAVFQTQRRAHAIATAQTAERLAALAVVGAVAVGATLTVLRAEAALATAAVVVCAAAYRFASIPLLRSREGPAVGIRDVTRAVGPMALVTAGAFVVAWVDLVVIAAFRDQREVGLYALAYQIFSVGVQVGALWIVAALPDEARRAAAGERARRVPREPVAAATRAWAAGVVGVAVVAAILLPLVFGSEFAEARGPLMALLVGATSLAPYYVVVAVLLAEHRARELAWLTLGAVAVNVVLDLALVPWLGPWGAAVATTAQTLLATLVAVGLAVGRARALEVARLIALPASALAVLAFSPESVVVLLGAGAVAAATGYRGLRALWAVRRSAHSV